MSHLTTDELLKQLRSARSVSQLNKYTSALDAQQNFRSFSEYLAVYLNRHEIFESELIEASGIQRNYAYQILSGAKNPGRGKALALCIAAHMSYEETQRALALANLGKLYPRRKEDSVIIYAIEHKLSVQQTNDLLYSECGGKSL